MEPAKISVTCSSCQAKYRVPESLSARKITCKKCGKPIFLTIQGAFREKNGKPRRSTRTYSRLKRAPVKLSGIHLLTAGLTIILVGVLVKLVIFH